MPAHITHRRYRPAVLLCLLLGALLLSSTPAVAAGHPPIGDRSSARAPHIDTSYRLVREGMTRATPAPTAVSPLVGRWASLAINAPQPSSGAALAWDSADGVMFLFGGGVAGGASNDLWAYRPVATRAGAVGWTHIAVSGVGPQVRAGASAVWDSADRVLLLFDGSVTGREIDELWAYKPGRNGTTAGRWVDLSTEAGVLRRAYHSAVWDSADGVMLVFGGEVNGVRLADTWAYRPGKGGLTPGRWTRLGAAGPAPRQDAMAAWDSADRVLLLAGGRGYGDPLTDLWTFRPDHHGAAGAWTRLATSTPLGPRAGAAAVWDATRGRLLIFGGDVSTPTPAPTHGKALGVRPTSTATPTATRTLTPTVAPPTSTPLPPSASATATASATASPTATSTNTPSNTPTNTPTPTPTNSNTATATSTATNTATPTATPTETGTTGTGGSAPRAVARTSPTGGNGTGRPPTSRPGTLLVTAGATYVDDLWAYSPGRHATGPGRWQLVGTDGPSPRASAAVYDDRDHLVILRGGQGVAALGDVWVYPVTGRGAGHWSRRDGGSPQARSGVAAAWDGRDRALFIFGGFSGSWLNDLWAYKPMRGGVGHWALIAAPGAPAPRTEASLVWDNADGVLLLFGGANATGGIMNDVWAYTPAGDGTGLGRWTRLLVSGTLPYARHLHTAVWDDRDGQMLVFGGETATAVLRDLWAFHLARGRGAWRQVMAETPLTPRFAQSTVWDSTHGQMLVFGGASGSGRFLDDLWAYHPSARRAGSWTTLGPPGGPAPSAAPGRPDGRATAGAAWDPADRALLLVGGTGLGSYRNDTYAYRPAAQANASRPAAGWTALDPAGPPTRRSSPIVVFDTVSGGLLLYGGTSFDGAYNDLWQLGGVPPSPAHPTTHKTTKKPRKK